MDILSIRELTKSFGSRTVIDHLHLSVPAHSVFGFIGKNGAGKTTTMRMIVGLLKPDHGEIQVNGERVSFGENQTNRYIGYLPDVPEYYGFMTASQYLTLCGEITGMQSSDVRRRILDLLDLVGLTDSKKHIHLLPWDETAAWYRPGSFERPKASDLRRTDFGSRSGRSKGDTGYSLFCH